LKPGEEACQRPIDVPTNAALVEFQVGTFRRPGPPLETTVRPEAGPAASATLAGGYADNSLQQAKVGGIEGGGQISLCVRNIGKSQAALYGSGPQSARTSALFLNGREHPDDLMLRFRRGEPRSTISLLPAIFDRASLFRAGWVESWLFWVLAALLVTAVPLALALSLARATRD
jgi:hypothetical protein